MKNKKKVIVIRQNAVLPTDKLKPKAWREVVFCRWLVDMGYDVELICSSFDHYSKVNRNKNFNNEVFKVTVLPTIGYKHNVSIRRIIDNWYFSFFLFFKLLYVKKNDVLYTSMPNPEPVFITALISRLKRNNLIVDIRDVWPDAFPLVGKTTLKALLRKYCYFLLRPSLLTARTVTGVTDRFISLQLDNLNLVNSTIRKISFITHDLSSDYSETKTDHFDQSEFNISFFGSINEQFSFDTLRNSIDIMEKEFPKVKFHIFGSGICLAELELAFIESQSVCIHGHVPYATARSLMMKSDALFCFYRNKELFDGHLTNKLIEYISCKKPILHNFDGPFIVNAKEYQFGVTTTKNNIVQSIEIILADEYDLSTDRDLYNAIKNTDVNKEALRAMIDCE